MADTVPLEYQRDYERWYPLIEHPVQKKLIEDTYRFKVVPAGRRSGKTERAKRYVVREAFRCPNRIFFVAAPTRDQVKKIYWEDLKKLCFTSVLGDASVSESELTVRLPNGASIRCVGLDKPQRMEGISWAGGIIDEIDDTKPNAWEENISPALNTVHPMYPDYRAWCWLIGVPGGLNHYYDLAEMAKRKENKDWQLYTWHSADILPADVLDEARRTLSPRQFRQEYEASFETAAGKIYEDYSQKNHTNEKIKPTEQLHWFHDFNFTPLSSGVGVRRNKGKDFYVLDEIILTSAVARQSALEFCDRYRNHKNRDLLLYGDPAGKAGEKHGHASDYTEMEKVLRTNGWNVTRQVKNAAPAIRDRQNAVRAKILNAAGETSLYVNPDKCPYTNKGLATTQLKEGSTFLEDDKDEYQHITTAVGYCVDYIWPIRPDKKKLDVKVQGVKHHWRN